MAVPAKLLEQAVEPVVRQKFAQRPVGNILDQETFERIGQGTIVAQRNQHPRQTRLLGKFDQIVAHFGFFHFRRGGEHAFDVAKFVDQLRRGLRANSGNARDIIRTVAHQPEHIAQLFRPDAEFLFDRGAVHSRIFHRVEHVDPAFVIGFDQLHQILVGRDDRDMPALCQCSFGIGGDHIVGLDILFLDQRQRESACGITDHRKLRPQVLGRFRTIGLILVIEIIAETGPRLVQHHRHMSRAVRLVEFVGEFPQHRRIAIDRTNRLAAYIGQRRQAVIGAENIGRAVNEIEMVWFAVCRVRHNRQH